MLLTGAIVIFNACTDGAKSNDNSPQPTNSNLPNENSSPASVQDLLTASRSSDKTTRLNAIKGLEKALKTASMDDSILIGSRLEEMAQQDSDEQVRNEAMRVLTSGIGGNNNGQNQPSGNGGNQPGSQSGGNTTSDVAGYAQCIKKVKHASDANNILISTPLCSPLFKGNALKEVQDKLSQWTQSNCSETISIENARFPYQNYRVKADSPWRHYGTNVKEISDELSSGSKCMAERDQSVTWGTLEEIK